MGYWIKDFKLENMLEKAAEGYKKKTTKSKEIKLARCPICGKPVRLVCYEDDGSGILLHLTYKEELNELNYAYGYIHCYGCDADFSKATDSPRELIDWWNTRIPMEEVLKDMRQLEEDYRYETNAGFIDMCIDIVKREIC